MLAAATGVETERTLHLSTGIIGTRLPLDKVAAGSGRAGPDAGGDRRRAAGGRDGAAHDRFADQDRDDDRRAARPPTARPVTVRVSGVAKGVGMIHPRMATMLSIVLTDATVAPEVLWGMLRPAAARTWNQLSVDGDTSTNDTVFVLASGAAGAAPVEARFAGRGGARRARSRRSRATWPGSRPPTARAPARSSRPRSPARGTTPRHGPWPGRSISSSLVKAAAHGRDPNWGRIAGAAGNARLADAAGARGGRSARGRGVGPCRAPRPCSIPRRSGSRSPVTSSSTARGRPGRRSIARRHGPRWTRRKSSSRSTSVSAREVARRFGCDLTETYVIENSEYTT